MSKKQTAVDKDLVRDLATILNETDLTEIEVEQDDLRIRVSRQSSGQPVHVAAPAIAAPATPAPIPVAAPPIEVAAAAPAEAGSAVTSPMVGTAYLAPAPGAEPFVKLGDKVTEGQTVLIIEAMKTMNQIPAPKNGTITAMHVDDQQPVEYGEPLFSIE